MDRGTVEVAVEEARQQQVLLEIARRSQAEAEVESGVEVSDRVVVYPSDRVEHGVRFEER